MNRRTSNRPTFGRRTFLRASFAALAAQKLALRPALAAADPTGRAKRLVFVYLAGGASHLDTFDPKPGSKHAGSFRAIPTRIEGVSFGQHLPQLAERADRLAVIRSLTSTEGSHARARYLLHTAYPPNPSVRHPSIGASLSHEIGDAKLALPSYVALGGPGEGAGFFGPGHAPFVVKSAPGKPIENLKSPADVDARRLDARLELVTAFDASFAKAGGEAEVRARAAMIDRAKALMRSPHVRAFDLDDEPASARAAYGETPFGGRCLTARRLLEAGVSCVEIELSGWDTHEDNFNRHKALCAELDPAVSALLDDLAARDLASSTLVVVAGEFGRSPKINAKEGRDHHPKCFSALVAGGGVRGGTVIGASDADGEEVARDPVTMPDLFATLFAQLGVNGSHVYTSNDRPLTLSNSGKLIKGLI